MKLAVDAFDYSFKHEAEQYNIQQSMGLGGLLISLCLKINDLDWTLLNSHHLGVKFFKQSIVEEVDPVTFRENTSKYTHVTGQGSLIEILKDNLIPQTPGITGRIKKRFFKRK